MLIKIKAPFGEKLSGRIMIKMFGSEKAFTMKIRIENNQGCVQFVNKGHETIKLRESKAIGILDLRSVGYFKVSYQKLITMAESRQTFKMYHYQQVRKDRKEHLDDYHKMSRANRDEGYSERSQNNQDNTDKYPWLAKDYPRRYQTDAEILYEKIDLKDSALTKKEKAKLMKIPTPKTAKQCKCFCGVVNYLSLFCPDLQTLLKPIVELTRKGRPFVWGQEQEKAFKEVKLRLTNPPVLHLPKAEGRFILYSDKSVEGTGSSLWQMQEGKAKLIGYASKTLPEACSRYSVTELEMTGLLVNINLWKNPLKHREFDAAVDHVAITQIMRAKTEPATTRIMRLLDRLSAYSFNLYYVKGRDMILADYLSRHRNKDLDSSELIPISFCCMKVFRSLLETEHGLEVYNISTRSNTKASGEIPPEVHGADKPLDPNLKPEHQSKFKLPSVVGAKSPIRSPTKMQTPKRSPRKSVAISEEIPITSYETDPIQDPEDTFSDTPQVVTKPVLKLLPPTSPITQMTPKRVLSSIPEGDDERENKIETLRRKYRKALNPTPIEGIDVSDSEEVLDPQIRIPDQNDFELPPPLQDIVDPSKITHKFLPKQGEIDRLINQINKKVLRDTKLSMNLRFKSSILTKSTL